MGQFPEIFALSSKVSYLLPCRVWSDPMLPTPPAAQPPPTPQGPNVDVVPRGSIRDPLRRGTLRPSPHHPPRRPGRHPSPSSPPPSHTCLSAQQPRCTARSLPHALTRRAPASAAPAPPTPAPAPAAAPAAAASARRAGLLPALRPFALRPRLWRTCMACASVLGMRTCPWMWHALCMCMRMCARACACAGAGACACACGVHPAHTCVGGVQSHPGRSCSLGTRCCRDHCADCTRCCSLSSSREM